MKPSNSSIVAKVRNFLTETIDKNQIEALARSTGFVQKRSKITGVIFAKIMIFEIRQTKSASLNALTTKLGLQGVPISKQGLDNRFNESAVTFMKELTDKVLSTKLDRHEVLDMAEKFNRIMIKDSTVFQLPDTCALKYPGHGGGASAAGMKIQYEYDLKAKGGLNLRIQPAKSPDNTNYLKDIRPMDLCLEDLGYFTLVHLDDIIEKKACFLMRLSYGACVFYKKDNQYHLLDMDKLVRTMEIGQMMELSVYLGRKKKIPVRMILERVPDEVASEKRRKLKTDRQNKRRGLTKGRLAFCDVNAYVTNADDQLLPGTLIRPIYSLRWQVEIIFKTWKSTFNLDKVNQMKVHRMDCINYGTLLQIIICTKLYNYYKTILWNNNKLELSEIKSMKYIQSFIALAEISVLSRSLKKLDQLINRMLETLEKKCVKERKNGRNTPMMILNQLPLA